MLAYFRVGVTAAIAVVCWRAVAAANGTHPPALPSTISVRATCTDKTGAVHHLRNMKLRRDGVGEDVIVIRRGAGTEAQQLSTLRAVKLGPVEGQAPRLAGVTVTYLTGKEELQGKVALDDAKGNPIIATGQAPGGGKVRIPLAECEKLEILPRASEERPHEEVPKH